MKVSKCPVPLCSQEPSPQDRTCVEGASPSPSEQPGSVHAAPWLRILVVGGVFQAGGRFPSSLIGEGRLDTEVWVGRCLERGPFYSQKPHYLPGQAPPCPWGSAPLHRAHPQQGGPGVLERAQATKKFHGFTQGEKGALGLPSPVSMLYTPFSPKPPSKSPPPFPPSPRVRASSKPPVQDIRGHVSLRPSPSFQRGLPGKPQG